MHFAGFKLVRKLGVGGLGEAWLAESSTATPVVIKRLRPGFSHDELLRAQLQDEARLLAGLRHELIAQLLDVGQHDRHTYLVLEYVDGPDLAHLLETLQAPIPAPVGLKIMRDVAEALAYAHDAMSSKGEPLLVVHRDVSPSNIILSASKGAAKLLDFGVAKSIEASTHTTRGLIKGKTAYLSPEQLREQSIDRRADMFAWAVVCHEVLTSRHPFRAKTPLLSAEAIIAHEPARIDAVRPEVPVSVGAVIAQAMAKDRAHRFADMRVLLAAFDAAAPEIVRMPRKQIIKWLADQKR